MIKIENPFDSSSLWATYVKLDQTTPQLGIGTLQFQNFYASGGASAYDYYGAGDSYFNGEVTLNSLCLNYFPNCEYGISSTAVATFTQTISPLYDLGTIAYTSQYPPAQNSTYVKATTTDTADGYQPYYATDPAKSLTGTAVGTSWFTNSARGNQRINVDLGSAQVIKRIYYENFHNSGNTSDIGSKDIIIQGSNTAGAFADTGYAADSGWTAIATDQSFFDQHVPFNQTDKKYIYLTNTTAYRYYSIKIAINYGNATGVGLRRVEFQSSGTGTPTLSLDSDARKLYGIDGTSLMVDYSQIGYIRFGQNVVQSQYIIGSQAANGSIILSGTNNPTKTASKLLLQPYGGLVGFGTDSPLIPFHVANPPDAVSMTLGSTADVAFGVAGDSTAPYGLYFGRSTANGRAWIQAGRTDSATAYALSLNASGGNVGIGTSNPANKLHVYADDASPLYVYKSGSGNSYSKFENADTGYNIGIRLISASDWYIISGGSLGVSGRLSFLNNTSGNTNLYLEYDGSSVFTGTVKFAGTKSSDGSAGISTTVTTASLVGKTMTFKNGLLTAFA